MNAIQVMIHKPVLFAAGGSLDGLMSGTHQMKKKSNFLPLPHPINNHFIVRPVVVRTRVNCNRAT